jgi:hypothetical protein
MLGALEVDTDQAYMLSAAMRSYGPLLEALKIACGAVDLLTGVCLVGLPGKMIGARFDFAPSDVTAAGAISIFLAFLLLFAF